MFEKRESGFAICDRFGEGGIIRRFTRLMIRKVARFALLGLLAYRMCANAHDGYEPRLGFSPSLGMTSCL